MKKLLLFCFSLLILSLFSLLISVKPTNAAENFDTSYNVTYTVNEAGITRVTMKIGLTNTTSDYYASSYKIRVGFDDIANLNATDPGGQIAPQLEKTKDGYSIGVVFNKLVVGKGNTLPFTLTFDTKDIAKNRGSVWSVNIPGIADQKDFSDFTVAVVVPPSFGQPAFIKPKQESASLTFTKQQLGEGGISIAFGSEQGFTFYLTYHLKNKNVFPIKTEIALPPSTNYQEVFYSSIEPEPITVVQDKDGNWLAEYYLMPSQKIDVTARGNAILSLTPKKQPESPEALKVYLKEQQYWQVSGKEIKRLAQELKTPEAIYHYVVKALQYDFARVTDSKPRLGAAGVLNSPTSAVCLEFTDLFIAVARAAGIPAREVNGYAYTENDRQRPLSLVKDILHAWPEYYDAKRETWIMVDPTWGNTTGGIDYFEVLDFDHFTFVRKGVSSSYPIPAGGYKFNDTDESKDVHVEFGDVAPLPPQKVTILPDFQPTYLSFLNPTGTIKIKNVGQVRTSQSEVTILSSTLQPYSQRLVLPEIPPYGTREVPVAFKRQPLLTNREHTFTIQIGENRINHTIKIVPFLFPDWKALGGIIIGISGIIILITTYKSGRIPILGRKASGSVHRKSKRP